MDDSELPLAPERLSISELLLPICCCFTIILLTLIVDHRCPPTVTVDTLVVGRTLIARALWPASSFRLEVTMRAPLHTTCAHTFFFVHTTTVAEGCSAGLPFEPLAPACATPALLPTSRLRYSCPTPIDVATCNSRNATHAHTRQPHAL
jgi:hypothetical protein